MKTVHLIWIRIALYTIWALASAWTTAMAGVKWASMGWEEHSCLIFGMILSWSATLMAFFDKAVWQLGAERNGGPDNGQPGTPTQDNGQTPK